MRKRIVRIVRIGSIIFSIVIIAACGLWLRSRNTSKDMARAISRAARLVEKEYSELKKDNRALLEARKDFRNEAVGYCERLRERWDFSKFQNGPTVEQAIRDGLESLQTGQIEDNIPRLVFACLRPEVPVIRIIWLESDFDTLAICFAGEDSHTIIEERIFANHNLEKRYFFHYYRMFDASIIYLDELPAGEAGEATLYVLVEYVGDEAPFFGPAFFLPLESEMAKLRVPEGGLTVWLRDKAGHESNRLPVLTVTADMLPEGSQFEKGEFRTRLQEKLSQ